MNTGVKIFELLPAKTYNANTNGSAVDLQDYVGKGELRFFLSVGSVSGTSPTLDVKIQQSDAAGSGFADIAGAAFAQVTATGSQEIKVTPTKRYVRAVVTVGGTSPVFGVACVAVGKARVI
jgi:hypothetical protein